MTLFGYYADLLAEKRRHPADDLASALLAVEDGGDRMSDQEIIAFLFLMVVAGNETTTKLLGNAVFHLTADPEQRDRVFADPDDTAPVNAGSRRPCATTPRPSCSPGCWSRTSPCTASLLPRGPSW